MDGHVERHSSTNIRSLGFEETHISATVRRRPPTVSGRCRYRRDVVVMWNRLQSPPALRIPHPHFTLAGNSEYMATCTKGASHGVAGFEVRRGVVMYAAIGGIFGVYGQARTEGKPPMALSQSALSVLLEAFRSGEGVDLIRESVRMVMQELIEAEASERIGAGRYERTEGRVTDRNGARPRLVATQAGDIELRIPKLRKGSFFPAILEPRRRIDQALYAVVMEAYVQGVSTRSVDDLVEAMGVESGISKSEVSRICQGLDEVVGAFRTRRLDHTGFPYVYLDATYLHVRNSTSQVVSMAVVVATGVTATGEREILGLDVGDSEDEVFWRGFLTSLKQRGLSGVRLVISDQHAGLVAALRRSFQGAGYQRCRVHFARNPARARAEGPGRLRRRGVPHDLRPGHRRRGRRRVEQDPPGVRRPVPQARSADGRGQGRGTCVHRLPAGALAQDLVHEPARAGQQGDPSAAPASWGSSRTPPRSSASSARS
jgi:putative transposase